MTSRWLYPSITRRYPTADARVTCPDCGGHGTLTWFGAPDSTSLTTLSVTTGTCPRCQGEGTIPKV